GSASGRRPPPRSRSASRPPLEGEGKSDIFFPSPWRGGRLGEAERGGGTCPLLRRWRSKGTSAIGRTRDPGRAPSPRPPSPDLRTGDGLGSCCLSSGRQLKPLHHGWGLRLARHPSDLLQ